jgi:hypothetical protein
MAIIRIDLKYMQTLSDGCQISGGTRSYVSGSDAYPDWLDSTLERRMNILRRFRLEDISPVDLTSAVSAIGFPAETAHPRTREALDYSLQIYLASIPRRSAQPMAFPKLLKPRHREEDKLGGPD